MHVQRTSGKYASAFELLNFFLKKRVSLYFIPPENEFAK